MPSGATEDIDRVQTAPARIRPALDVIHDALDGWLGEPRRKQSEGRVTLNYHFDSEVERRVVFEASTVCSWPSASLSSSIAAAIASSPRNGP